MQRNYSIDALRTIATLLVIVLHISASYVEKGVDTNNFDASFWIANIIDSFSRISVPIFVLISGGYLLGRNEPLPIFYSKRLTRIFIPIIVWSVLYSAYRFVGLYFLTGHWDYVALLESLALGKPFYHMWYLFMLIGLYAVVPAIDFFITKLTSPQLWALSAVLMILGMLITLYNQYFENRPFFLLWFVNYLGYFILGYLMKATKIIAPFLLVFIYFFSSVLIALLTYYTALNWDSLYFYGYLTPFVITGSLAFYKLFLQLELKENFLSKTASLTFGIYLVHAGVLDIVNRGASSFQINFIQNPLWGIPIKLIVVFMVSLLITQLLSSIKWTARII